MRMRTHGYHLMVKATYEKPRFIYNTLTNLRIVITFLYWQVYQE